MHNEKYLAKISKFLSLVLRHKPETISIKLDENGWADVAELLEKLNAYGITIDSATLTTVVTTNNKQRFSFNETLDKIRANQGHSIEVQLDYILQQPPEILFHGTGEKFVGSIMKSGIDKRNRHHVHLSKDFETAHAVGQRHGKPIVLEIIAAQMYADSYKFYLSENGVWLTDYVPVNYIRVK